MFVSKLKKLNWFRLTGLITLGLLMWNWMGQFFRKSHRWRCWSCLTLLNWIGALTISKTAFKKTEALIPSVKFFSLSLLSIYINLPFALAWNTVVMFWLVLLAAREHQQLGFVTLNGNLAVSGWVGLAYDR